MAAACRAHGCRKASDGIAGLGPLWFFFDRGRSTGAVERHDTITLRVIDAVGKDRCARAPVTSPAQQGWHSGSEEKVVLKDQRDMIRADEFATNYKGLCEAIRLRLHCVRQI